MTGEYWTVGYVAETFSIRSTKGLFYIHRLLQHPGEEFHALDLLSGPGTGFIPDDGTNLETSSADTGLTVGGAGDSGEMLDAKAKQDYKRRLIELREELEDARELGNSERSAEIESEIDFLAREISRAVGLGGRHRRAGSAAERARLNVTRAIKTALQKISEHNAELGKLLEGSIRTGLFCSFIEDRRSAIDWRFSIEGADPETKRSETAPALARRNVVLLKLADRTMFVGRESERALLRRKLDQGKTGNGTIVLISGPPGIGKTRIAHEICNEASNNGFLTAIGACYDTDSSVPFNPFVEILETTLAQEPDPVTRRWMLGDDAAELARLMPQLRQTFPDIPPPLEVAPEYSRRVLLNAFVAFLNRVAGNTPVFLLIDDLHWADEDTLSLLNYIARAVARLPIMIVGTYRDTEFDSSGSLAATLDVLARMHVLEHLSLCKLPESAVGQMISALGQSEAPESVVKVIYSGTEGNPFFVEELFRHLAERGKLIDSQGRFYRTLRIDEAELPHSVRLVIGRRLATVNPETRRMLDIAAIVGSSFTFALLEKACAINPDCLVDFLEEAEATGLISSGLEHPQVRFQFSHALIRQSVLADVSASKRQRLHARVGSILEEISTNSAEAHIDELAYHFWNAGDAVLPEKTIGYLASAARAALNKSAYDAALMYLGNALKTIERMPPSRQRAEFEVDLLLDSGVALLARKGWYVAELGAAYLRARELCQTLGDDLRRFFAVSGLWTHHLVKGEHPKSSAYAGELLALAPHINVAGLTVQAYWAEGCSRFFAGELHAAHRNFEAALVLYDRNRDRTLTQRFGQDPCVSSLCFDAMTLWHLGLTEQAERQAVEALRLARELQHPFTLVWCMTMLAKYYSVRRDFEGVARMTDEAIPMNQKLGFEFWQESLLFYRTIRSALTGKLDQRLALSGGSKVFASAGYALAHSWATANLAEAFAQAEQLDIAEDLLTYAFTVMERNEERYAESELYRIKGELALRRAAGCDTPDAFLIVAEECFRRALSVAGHQAARMLELRAANSFALMLLRFSRAEEARQLLKQTLQFLDEARDTSEYLLASRLLEDAQSALSSH